MRAVAKLRIGYAAMAGMALLMGLTGLSAIRTLERNTVEVSERTLPALIALDELNAESFALAEASARLLSSSDADERQRALDQLVQLEQSIVSTFEENEALLEDGALETARNATKRLQGQAVQLVELASQAGAAEAGFADALSSLRRAVAEIIDLGASEQIRASLELSGGENQTAALDIFRKAVAVGGAAVKLQGDTEALEIAVDDEQVARIEWLMHVHAEGLYSVVARLAPGSFRDEMTSQVVTVHDLVSEGAIFAAKRDAVTLRAKDRALVLDVVAATAEIKSLTSAAASGQAQRLQQLQSDLATRAGQLGWLMTALAALAALIAAAVVYYVVERQISRRLRRLERNALLIGEGILDKPSLLRGNDEIGLIGDAIERLRELSLRQNELEHNLRDASAAAQSSAQAKADFLALMSHEVRTPLNAIMGMFELIERADIPDRQKRRASNGKRAAEDLFELLSKVLDASRLEADSLTVSRQTVTVEEMVEFARDHLEAAVVQHGKDLQTAAGITGDPPPEFTGDRQRLKQILSNLIDNAVRFTDAGEITICCSAAELNGAPAVQFTVKDSGAGIAESDLELIFEQFRQVEGGIKRRIGGSGLGLAISKKLAHLMGGELSCESELGKGSSFRLIVPAGGDVEEVSS